MTVPPNYVVLLRGVNAGPNNRIAMPQLRAALESERCGDVETVAQSGSVVLSYDGSPAQVEAVVRGVLASRFRLHVDVIVRDEDALAAVVADNPLGTVATDGRRHVVVFCSDPHDSSRLPDVAPPEQLICRPRELHAWCPNGVSTGKLLPALTRRPPAPVTTFRNWNTISRLAQILAAR